MKRALSFVGLAAAGLVIGLMLGVPGLWPRSRSPIAARSEPIVRLKADAEPAWTACWETLKAKAVARLDDLDQRADELGYQEVAVKKASAALAAAQRDLDVAQRALREYEEGAAPQDRLQAEGELTVAQAEHQAASDLAERRARSAPASGADPPAAPAPPAAASDDSVAARAKLAVELARLKRDTLVRLTQPRRSAELGRDAERAKDDVALKRAALDQELADAKKLRQSLRDDALVPDERRALALLAEIEHLAAARDPKLESLLSDAAALWNGADRARTARQDAANARRYREASQLRATGGAEH